MTSDEQNFATYIRVSTVRQETGEISQRDSIQQWLDRHGVESHDEYADIAQSGSDDTRQQFNQLLDAVRDGTYSDVVMPEISRLARRTSTAAEFIDVSMEQGVTIHLIDDMIDSIDPGDPMSQFFAKFLGLWYEEERKQTQRRIQRGVEQAQRQGKWTGRVPTGFETDEDGYLQVDLEEYLAIRNAMVRVLEGESQRSVGRDTRFTRQTISNLLEERRSWYIEAEPERDDHKDELAAEALTDADIEAAEVSEEQNELSELEQRIAALEKSN